METSGLEDKSLSVLHALHLAEQHEVRSTLRSVFCCDGFAVAGFSWGAVSFLEAGESRLRDMIGREVASLRLDGTFHIREVVSRG